MSRSKRLLAYEKISAIIRRIVQQEGMALFIGLSIFTGAAMFFVIMQSVGRAVPAGWWWLAITVALFSLPKVFRKLRSSQEPYIVRFAQAFRAGFWSLAMFLADFANVLEKVQWPWIAKAIGKDNDV